MGEKKLMTLDGAGVCIKYKCGSATKRVTGIFRGTQLKLSEKKIFILLTKKDKIDRFVPIDGIVYIDILEPKYDDAHTLKDDSLSYIG